MLGKRNKISNLCTNERKLNTEAQTHSVFIDMFSMCDELEKAKVDNYLFNSKFRRLD